MIVRSTGPPGMVSSRTIREKVPDGLSLISYHSGRVKPTPVNPLELVKTIRPFWSYQVSASFSRKIGKCIRYTKHNSFNGVVG